MSAETPRELWRALLGLIPTEWRTHPAQRRPRRWPPPRLPDEDLLARAFRHAEDRRHLADLDDRLLLDVGLDRDVIECGFPFDDLPAPASSSRRIHP